MHLSRFADDMKLGGVADASERVWCIFLMRRGCRTWVCLVWRGLRGDLIMPVNISKVGARLLSVVPSKRMRSSGCELKLEKF